MYVPCWVGSPLLSSVIVPDGFVGMFEGWSFGSTSQFGGANPALKGVTVFEGVVKDAMVAGESFKDVKFTYPPAK